MVRKIELNKKEVLNAIRYWAEHEFGGPIGAIDIRIDPGEKGDMFFPNRPADIEKVVIHLKEEKEDK